ncbi:MAG: hypothetical protein IJT35_05620 [Paludibacteraceae bacterium]|nr:hypothetical protein [Paludibacteraceae bacterium]
MKRYSIPETLICTLIESMNILSNTTDGGFSTSEDGTDQGQARLNSPLCD